MGSTFLPLALVLAALIGGDAETARKADEAYAAKDYKVALPLYQKLAQEDPKAIRPRYRVAVCQLETGDLVSAEKNFALAKSLGAPSGPVSYNLACLYLRQGHKEKGLKELEACAAAGFRDIDMIKGDSDFDSVRSEPRYLKALAKIENPLIDIPGGTAMDHWVGEWDVYYDGKLHGSNSIKKVMRGYGITESYRPGGGEVMGMSLFAFDSGEKVWRHTWTNTDGWTIFRTGRPVKDGIYFEGISSQPGQPNQKTREWITKLPNGDVRQLIEMQDNKSKKWTPIFDGVYKRKKG